MDASSPPREFDWELSPGLVYQHSEGMTNPNYRGVGGTSTILYWQSGKTCNYILYYVIATSVMALASDAVSSENESDSRENPGSRILPIRLSTLASQKRAAARSHDEVWT